jgi:indolepyruvate decarboxylase
LSDIQPQRRGPVMKFIRDLHTDLFLGLPGALFLSVVALRPLILVGDGAFQMTGWELGNRRRYGLDPIVVLFNNMSWEMLRVFQPESHFNDLDDWHFADIAAPIGGVGERVITRR